LLDVPGSSLGVELAERLEFGPEITQRAKELRNADSSGESQELLDQLRRKVQELENQKKGLQATRKELDVERARWEHEKDIVVAAKKTTRSKVRDEYSRKFESMERGFFSLTDQLKKLIKESKKKSSDQLQAELGSLTQQFGQRYASAKESSRNASEVSVREGPVVADDLVKGKTVFVVSLQKKVKVTQTIEKSKLTKYLELLAASEGAALSSELKGFLKRQKIEVAIGALKSFVALVDLKSLA
jgi:transketolase